MNRPKELDKKDSSAKKLLYSALVYTFMDQPVTSILAITTINKQLSETINDIRYSATELSNEHAEEDDDSIETEEFESTRADNVYAFSLVMPLVSTIIYKLADMSITEALKEVRSKSDLIATTEFFRQYNSNYIANIQSSDTQGEWEWHSELDSRTCSKCSSLSGERFPKDKPPEVPAHARCRCFVRFLWA